MKILHYSLGFPPYRSGGLTKFCMDIMQDQKRIGHDVCLLWPGEMKIFDKKVTVKFRGENHGIDSWEIINPLPISYDEGIVDIKAFTAKCDPKAYLEALAKINPDVVHIHTFMGLHREFVDVAKELGIKTVFTVHDFFSICPKVTMFRNGIVCSAVNDCSQCPECNLTALSLKKIMILQSPIYRQLKDSAISKKLRKIHRDQYLSGKAAEEAKEDKSVTTSPCDYEDLRSYYGGMISKMDIVHYNSSVTKDVFEQYFHPQKSAVISISHADIKDNRYMKKFGENLRITYLGPQSGAKGFFLLKDSLDQLWNERQDFSLNVFFTPIESSPYMKTHGRYAYSDLESIFEETDILIAPSIWYETFGYIVLEALSFGVPVVVSENVGAKDIIPDGGGIILKSNSASILKDCLMHLNADKLLNMNMKICQGDNILTLSKMNSIILKEIY